MTLEQGITRALVDAAQVVRWEELPEEPREVERHCLLDFLGVALAGAREPLTGILIEAVGPHEPSSEAGRLGRAERASRLSAALVNGAAAHALDFDDTHTAMNGHPSVPVLPALLALAETEAASGERLLAALVAGIELECRLASGLRPGHYAVRVPSTAHL